MRNVDVIKASGCGGSPWSDSVQGSALVLTDFTLIKTQLNDTFMQMFFKLLLVHKSGKVSYIFIFVVSPSLPLPRN